MKLPIPLLALALLVGCATAPAPYSPVEDVAYSAIGADPFWMVAIGNESIVLTLGPGPGANSADLRRFDYPRVLPRITDGVRRWETGFGTEVLTIEARPGPCTGAAGREFEDRVTVALSGRMLEGCGGHLVAWERD